MQVYSHANDAHQQGITTKKQTYAALFPKSWRTSISLVHCCNLLLGSKVWPAIIKKKKSFFLVFFVLLFLKSKTNNNNKKPRQNNNLKAAKNTEHVLMCAFSHESTIVNSRENNSQS